MAIYTEVTKPEIIRFLDSYDLGRLYEMSPIAEGTENTNYLLNIEKKNYILTLYEQRVDPADLPFFLELMRYLSAGNIACPQPLSDRTGTALKSLKGRSAAVFTFLEGRPVLEIAPKSCAALGEILARFHLAGQDFSIVRKNALGLSSWRPLWQAEAEKADILRSGLGKIIDQQLDFLEENWPKDLPTGVCHADLFPDNVFFIKDKISGLIDFYFACQDFWAYDLAICLNAWCFNEKAQIQPACVQALLKAYQTLRPLEKSEQAAFPILCQGAAIRFFLTRYYDWFNTPSDALITPKDPMEYFQYLLQHQKEETKNLLKAQYVA